MRDSRSLKLSSTSMRKSKSINIRRTRIVGPSLKETLLRPWYIWSKFPPVSQTHPEIAKEWHPHKNGPWKPTQFTYASGQKVWWRCQFGHSWRATIGNRTTRHSGCPFCSGRKASKTNCLLARYPKVASEWHPTKNGDLTARDVTGASKREVWWLCGKNKTHAWKKTIYKRTLQNSRCPFCFPRSKNFRPSGFYPKMTRDYRRIFREWHPTKNGDRKPRDYSAGSGIRVWWKCRKGPDHEWRATIASRARLNVGCPFCRGLRASVTNSLLTQFPKLAAQWHHQKNGKLNPDQVTFGSAKVVWWRCEKDRSHVWKAPVTQRTMGHGCPFCAGRRVCPGNSLARLVPSATLYWSKSKNLLTPHEVTVKSNRSVWWKCPRGSDHVWQASVNTFVRALDTKSRGCPFCRGLKVGKDNSLAALNPELVKEWIHEKNKPLTPQTVTSGSNKCVWWKCPEGSDHVWQTTVNLRARRGDGCPFCRGLRVSKTNSLAARYPIIAKQWHPTKNDQLTPADVTYGSSKHAWWQCSINSNHVWKAVICNRTTNNAGCPECARLVRRKALANSNKKRRI